MKRLQHDSRLQAYTLPIVIDTLKEVSPPTRLLHVEDPRCRGPLLVTLAVETACVAADLLYRALLGGAEAESIERKKLLVGGASYVAAVANAASSHRTVETIHAKAIALETQILRFDDAALEHSGKSCHSSSAVHGGLLYWKKTSKLSKARKNDHGKLVLQLEAARKHASEAATALSDIDEKLGIGNKTKPSAHIDFETSKANVRESALGLLHRTDPNWCKTFRFAFDAKAREAFGTGLRLLLHLHPVLTTVRQDRHRGPDDALEPAFKASPFAKADIFMICSWTRENISQHRRQVRMAQDQAENWIRETGGIAHPFLLNQRSTPDITRSEARNQLFWCLCEGSSEKFTPSFTRSYPKAHWLQWLCRAESGKPEFLKA